MARFSTDFRIGENRLRGVCELEACRQLSRLALASTAKNPRAEATGNQLPVERRIGLDGRKRAA
jgi:hypothetical protein